MTFRLTPEKPPYYEPAIGGGAKSYTAILNQSSTNNPTANVLQNSLGHTVVWTWLATGLYQGSMHGDGYQPFPNDKTYVQISSGGNPPIVMATQIAPDEVIYITGWIDSITQVNGMDNVQIKIIIFN